MINNQLKGDANGAWELCLQDVLPESVILIQIMTTYRVGLSAASYRCPLVANTSYCMLGVYI